ncbi:MAG: polysaccharide deacetylase family protein [Chloroflexi bacterium]|nr:polysaccharide deacetylase family protein [Chloroflexota bacterium]
MLMARIALACLVALSLAACSAPPETPPNTTPAASPKPAVSGVSSLVSAADRAAASSSPTASSSTQTAVPSPAVARPSPSPTRVADLAQIKPNEVGDIIVLEYHHIGDEELRWTRHHDNFRKDLQLLYDRGYRIIGVHDYLDNQIKVPAGKRTIMMTFDDSNESQFRYLKRNDGTLQIDPDCAVGILEEFYKKHPDFGRGVGFSVLPKADPPNRFFNQPEYTAQKVKFLIDNGYELLNHTWYHVTLGDVSDKVVVEQVANGVKGIQEFAPGYKVRVLTLPLGSHPKNLSVALRGTFEGVEYHHEAVLDVSGGNAVAPDHRALELTKIPRIQAIQSELDRYLAYYERIPQEYYVSDGNPDTVTFPAALAKDFRPKSAYRELASPSAEYKSYRIR